MERGRFANAEHSSPPKEWQQSGPPIFLNPSVSSSPNLESFYHSIPIGRGVTDQEYDDLKLATQDLPSLNRKQALSLPLEYPISSSSITLERSFESVRYGATGTSHVPPDAALAVGLNEVLVAVNTSFIVYNKTGTPLTSLTSFQDFFAPISFPVGTKYFDPRAIYDSENNRFFMVVAASYAPTRNSWLLVSVSSGSNASGSWYTYTLDMTLNNLTRVYYWADYPGLGLDSQALYLTANMFGWDPDKNFKYSKIRILNKSQLLNALPVNYYDFFDTQLVDVYGNRSFGIQPVITHGNPGVEYLVNSNSIGGDYITVWSIANPLSFSPSLTKQTISVPYYSSPPQARQPSPGPLIDSGDARILNAVYQNGSIWTTNSTNYNPGTGSRSAIAIYELAPLMGTVQQSPLIWNPSIDFYYPSLMIDNQGDVGIVFEYSSESQYPSIAYTGHLASDPANVLQNAQQLKAGIDTYYFPDANNRNRWGDYTAIGLDPNGNTIWILGEYVAARNQWGMWVGAVNWFSSPSIPTQTPTSIPQPYPTTVTVTPTATSQATPTSTSQATPTPISTPQTTPTPIIYNSYIPMAAVGFTLEP